MRNAENHQLEMIAYEAFLRRASTINMPFMLKGSYVTRQYLPNGIERFPADLDWVYMHHLQDEKEAENIFSRWATEITQLDLNDGVVFVSFTENKFWRLIDYAMADDFPTVNTDLECTVHGHELGLRIDISFNLPINHPTVSLPYQPIEGEAFIVPFTVPLSLQVSWKIHQTLLRPRFKDLLDLTYLIVHPTFNADVRSATLQALVDECDTDEVDHESLISFFNYDFEKLYSTNSINIVWGYWRFSVRPAEALKFVFWGEMAENITDLNQIPEHLSDFLQNLKNNLEKAGLTPDLLKQPPISDYIERSLLQANVKPKQNKIVDIPESDKPQPTTLPIHQSTAVNNNSILKRFVNRLFKSK